MAAAIASAPLAAPASAGPSAAVAAHAPSVRILAGRSVRGRPIRALLVGDPAAKWPVLVVGSIHGNETAGVAVTRALRSAAPGPGAAIWIVDAMNPDGRAARSRYNARGVDLNRNAPWHWRRLPRPGRGRPYSGPRALSEPESRAIRRLVRRVRPAVTIWFHQHARLVDDPGPDHRTAARRYARLVGLPLRAFGAGLPGLWTGWQNAHFPRATAFAVELAAGKLSRRQIARHVAAVLDAAGANPRERRLRSLP